MEYETVIGLEVHAELAVKTKLFCSCSAEFGAEPNENVCPACCGMPGSPAVLNKRAVELAIAASLLVNGEITKMMTFDKKNYFYPDLPCGYQITQWFAPVCSGGGVEIKTGGGAKTITLKQIHLEEDAGKLTHDRRAGASLADFNRAGVPLIEIVSNPDFRSAEEAVAYLEKLRSLLSFAGVSDCKMQEGSMRCDINISVREKGSDKLGVRAEIKNMNSLKAISAAIEYESRRHIEALATGSEKLSQETRRWDDEAGETFAMREKEDATDYRYVPNPEVMPVEIGRDWINEIKNSMPETADEKYARLTGGLGLSDYDAGIITGSKNLSEIFDGVLKYYDRPKETANWIITELLSAAKGGNKGADDIKINCGNFAKLIRLVDNKTINRNVGKKILLSVLNDDADPEQYAERHGLGMIGDEGVIGPAVREALAENEKSVAEYKKGNRKVVGFLIGQVMRKLGGKADPKAVGEALSKELGE